jgi:hypothetical protein
MAERIINEIRKNSGQNRLRVNDRKWEKKKDKGMAAM